MGEGGIEMTTSKRHVPWTTTQLEVLFSCLMGAGYGPVGAADFVGPEGTV